MGYAENLKVMKAGTDEVEWSNSDGFPALIWFRNEHENNQLGWWLCWADASGGPRCMLISRDAHGEADAEVRAREVLAIARPGS
ncbi:MAG: hypothetical protein ACJ71Y_11640 [Blastococcus sp.]|jgi:hypothetical protein